MALGGPLGGGFAAPPVDTNVSGYDWTTPFRERVSACSKVPEGVDPGDKVSIASGTISHPYWAAFAVVLAVGGGVAINEVMKRKV